MMLRHSLFLAALSGLVTSHDIGDSLPSCAKPCFEKAEALVSCDLSKVSCLCSSLPTLMDNADVKTCLAACTPDDLSRKSPCCGLVLDNLPDPPPGIVEMAHAACLPQSTVLSGSSAAIHTTAAANATGLYTNATMTSGGAKSTSADTIATTTKAPAATGAPTTTPNRAGRSEFGMVALGIALAAALTL